MHFAFITYGARQEVERLLRDIESQKFQLKLTKEGEPDKSIWVTGQVRQLGPITEIVFPREYMGVVLTTMCTNTAPNRLKYDRTAVYNLFKGVSRKILGLKPIPKEYDDTKKLLWDLEYVSIIPLGIREDVNLKECKDMGYKDWNHEAL